MLKKTLIAIALLAIAMPAFGGNDPQTSKYHEWVPTKTYDYAFVGTIPVCMDIGYWIEIDAKGKCIEVFQNSLYGPAFTSYAGCLEDVSLKTNFDATLKATCAGVAPAGGDWSATIDNGPTFRTMGKFNGVIDICVIGTKVKIQDLLQSSSKVQVAEVTIWVIPSNLV